MAISSAGIGSGLDVKSIVSQLVALEQKPLSQLQTKASSISAKLAASVENSKAKSFMPAKVAFFHTVEKNFPQCGKRGGGRLVRRGRG